jgi:hypothetical protein
VAYLHGPEDRLGVHGGNTRVLLASVSCRVTWVPSSCHNRLSTLVAKQSLKFGSKK